MHYLDYNEQIQHRTGDFPLAYYPVDRHHPRYRMTMHWHRETELILVNWTAPGLQVMRQVMEDAAADNPHLTVTVDEKLPS